MANRNKFGGGQRGFTLIELMLAMAFVSFILLFVVLVLIQVMAIYNKGESLRQINQTGRQIADDMTWQIRNADPSSLKILAPNSSGWTGTANSNPNVERLCVGNVAYIWNTQDQTNNKNVMTNPSNSNASISVGLIRVTGQDVKKYCELSPEQQQLSNPDTNNPSSYNTLLYGATNGESVSSLINSSTGVLSLTVDHVAGSNLVQIKLALGTNGDNAPIKQKDGSYQCFTSDKVNAKPNEFCAFGEFDNIAYMRGGS
jgi:prepilin-type N-terminal cleavage/methylation domain-containing protein